jgi:hypothetical protein
VPLQGWISYHYRERVRAPVLVAARAGREARYLTLLVPFATRRPEVAVDVVEATPLRYEAIVTIDGRSERVHLGPEDIGVLPDEGAAMTPVIRADAIIVR